MMAWRKVRIALLSAAAMMFIGTIGIAVMQHPVAQADAPTTAPALMFIQAAPILPVKNIAASAEFYVDKLGFKMMWKYGDPVSLLCVGRDNTSIYLSQGGDVIQPTSVYMHVSDVEALRRQIAANGITPVEGPTDQQWGMREIIVEDPDGHRLRIGSIYNESALPSHKQK